MPTKPMFDEAGSIIGVEVSATEDGESSDRTKFEANQTALRDIGRQAARIARGIDPVPANKDAVVRALCEAIARLVYATNYNETE